MSNLTKLILFLLLHFIATRSQINLDRTDPVSPGENNDIIQHDCLHVSVRKTKETIFQQIISYCLNEYPSKWDIKEYHLNQKFTFTELFEMNITSEQLYIWSAPIDVVERYELYWIQRSTSKEISTMEMEWFYNCTPPTFGPLCQYSLYGYESTHLSLQDIFYDYYLQGYVPVGLTCYENLKCNTGTKSLCLDWRNICDGQIDCFTDGIDEQYCWELQINECRDDEYQCNDGRCIPITIFNTGDYLIECSDGSNTGLRMPILSDVSITGPTFIFEDARCLRKRHHQSPLVSVCGSIVNKHIVGDMFSDKSDNVSDDCWFAFRCYFHISDSNHPRCTDFCVNDKCQNIIKNDCPNILFVPNIPILFGHIYFAYTKDKVMGSPPSGLSPSYICYNDQLCSGFNSTTSFIPVNNTICRPPRDMNVIFPQGSRDSWVDSYVKRTFDRLYPCNTIPQTITIVCSGSRMYQCINSFKCIAISRMGDNFNDCPHGDDEQQDVIDRVCLNDTSGNFFYCKTTEKCINRLKLENGHCNCGANKYGICDDEKLYVHHITEHISFPTICDGFIELTPMNISGRYETDGTECNLWKCNNSYTRCDGFWNCADGADEVNCDPSPLLNCPLKRTCIAPNMTQLICVPFTKINDRIIDCLGAMDESNLCRLNNIKYNALNFSCSKSLDYGNCVWSQYACDEFEKCMDTWSSSFCIPNQNIHISDHMCSGLDDSTLSDIENYLCIRHSKKIKELSQKFFSLDGIKQIVKEKSTTKELRQFPVGDKTQYCLRGFPLLVWLDRAKGLNITTCLCPPNYYGNSCQYQNQRVSLTLKLSTTSDSRRTLFTIFVALIDNTNERKIHSHHQFTYLYMRDCQIRFNIYLLYLNRPKNQTKQYSIHIDVYEKKTLKHRDSFLIPVKFLFLPIQRITAQLNISRAEKALEVCSNQLCKHGKCIKYSKDPNNSTFCKCEKEWFGRFCNISYKCSCPFDSLCMDISADNRSICICPIDTFGPRCLFKNTICQLDSSQTCYNNGICIPFDEYLTMNGTKFYCICPKGFRGDRCEIPNTKIMISFHKNITLSQIMVVHFIEVKANDIPTNSSTFTTVSVNNKSAVIYWPYLFHISFIKLSKNDYYLMIVQNTYNASMIIHRTINPSDRCAHIREVLNEKIIELNLIRRIKYYHVPCQNRSLLLSCFYDDSHFCLCTDYGHERIANCFEFNYTKKFDCFGESSCINGGECLQDKSNCPSMSVCMCPSCFYGAQCQFSSDRFGLSLDGILGYHIQQHISLTDQPSIIQFSVALTITITLAGFIDGMLSTITFNDRNLQKNGCGLYLLGSSITTLILITIFALKFIILMISQINYISNRSFLNVQCYSIDFLLKVFINMDHWLNACVAMERAITSIKGALFDQNKSKKIAKYVIIVLLLLIIGTSIHDPISRKLLDEGDEYEIKRIWCIVNYSSSLRIFNSTMNLIHFFIPFIVNIISAIIIITRTAQQRRTTQKKMNYKDILIKQLQQHQHLLIAPIVLIIFAIPRLIISFVSGCMKSSDDAWLFLIGYFISFIPSMLTFVVFVLPSQLFKEVFLTNIRRYKINTRGFFFIEA